MRQDSRGPMLYCETIFSRGSGLGNRLFPWGRCKLFSRKHGCAMLAPRWAHVRTGSLLKGGVDLAHFARKVLLWDNFAPSPSEVHGWRRAAIRARYPREDERQALSRGVPEETIVAFQGIGQMFADLAGHHEFLLDELRCAARPKWRQVALLYSHLPIVLNIRRGRDFRDPVSPADFVSRGGVRTPLDWFVKALDTLRRAIGRTIPAYVISDGTARDLAPVLARDAVHHLRLGSAIADLLVLSSACVVIGSGGSAFSAWGAFLSRSPTLTVAGQSLDWFHVSADREPFIGTWDAAAGAESLAPFCAAAEASLRRRSIL